MLRGGLPLENPPGGNDRAVRGVAEVRHPAKWSNQLEPTIRAWLAGVDGPILDPMAGTGKFGFATHYNELEPEWAAQCPGQVTVADARQLPYADNTFAAVVTSPTYGNRMADHHEAKDDSRRNTYRHALGRPLTEGNSGAMQWGMTYREVHEDAWAEVYRVLEPGGTFVLNVKDHYRKGRLQGVPLWHLETARYAGFSCQVMRPIPCPGNRQGQNGALRVDHEMLYRFIKPTN